MQDMRKEAVVAYIEVLPLYLTEKNRQKPLKLCLNKTSKVRIT